MAIWLLFAHVVFSSFQGYKQQHAFIVTQHPMTSTVTDFWRMLCEQECSCVVLFDSKDEEGVRKHIIPLAL